MSCLGCWRRTARRALACPAGEAGAQGGGERERGKPLGGYCCLSLPPAGLPEQVAMEAGLLRVLWTNSQAGTGMSSSCGRRR